MNSMNNILNSINNILTKIHNVIDSINECVEKRNDDLGRKLQIINDKLDKFISGTYSPPDFFGIDQEKSGMQEHNSTQIFSEDSLIIHPKLNNGDYVIEQYKELYENLKNETNQEEDGGCEA